VWHADRGWGLHPAHCLLWHHAAGCLVQHAGPHHLAPGPCRLTPGPCHWAPHLRQIRPARGRHPASQGHCSACWHSHHVPHLCR